MISYKDKVNNNVNVTKIQNDKKNSNNKEAVKPPHILSNQDKDNTKKQHRDNNKKPFHVKDNIKKPQNSDDNKKPFQRDDNKKPFLRDDNKKPFHRDDNKPFHRDDNNKTNINSQPHDIYKNIIAENCSICSMSMITNGILNGTMLNCSHIYCEKCIKESLIPNKLNCAICLL